MYDYENSSRSTEVANLMISLLSDIDIGMVLTDCDGTVLDINQSAAKIFGVDPSEAIGADFSICLPMELRMLTGYQNDQPYEFSFDNRDILVWKRSLRADTVFYFFKDVSIEKNHDAEVRNFNQRIEDLKTVLQNSYDGIYLTDSKGLTIFVNKSHERISGIKCEQILGRYMSGLIDEGIFEISLTDSVVKEKKSITVSQKSSNGKQYLITGTPIFDKDGSVRRVITNVRDITELIQLEKELNRTNALKETYKRKLLSDHKERIVVSSHSFERAASLALKASQRDSTVLILGETGVGKDVIAKYIYMNSKRSKKEYIKINCGAIPANLLESELFGYVKGAFTGADPNGKMGAFELANGGTLFLDEIGELPLTLQASLLRVLQDNEITRVGDVKSRKLDVRVIAATNRDIEEMVRTNQFRRDLYYRLNVISILVPPLKERVDDIPALAEVFIDNLNQKYNSHKVITDGFIRYLCNRSWPGNVRELQNFIERQFVISDEDVLDESGIIDQNDTSPNGGSVHVFVSGIPPLKDAVDDLERRLLERALEQGKNTYRAAELLGISQSTFSRKYIQLCKAMPNELNDAE